MRIGAAMADGDPRRRRRGEAYARALREGKSRDAAAAIADAADPETAAFLRKWDIRPEVFGSPPPVIGPGATPGPAS